MTNSNSWVDVNLPWYVTREHSDFIPYLEFDEQVIEKFGKTIDQLEIELFPRVEYIHQHPDFQDKFPILKEFRDKVNNWIFDQPENIKISNQNKANSLADEQAQKEKCFSVRSECKPGVLLKVKTSNDSIKEMLVGHINVSGGACNDCPGIQDEDIVLAYKVVWSPEV